MNTMASVSVVAETSSGAALSTACSTRSVYRAIVHHLTEWVCEEERGQQSQRIAVDEVQSVNAVKQ